MPKRLVATSGRPPNRKQREARELLLNAATELFASHGVAGTTFVMIAKRAGFTPAMLHYYFKNRDRLLDAVVEERFMRFVSHIWDPVREDAEALVAVPEFLARMFDGIAKMPWVPALWLREIVNEGGLLRARVLPILPWEKAKWLGGAIARGQKSGTLNPDLDPQLSVTSAICLVMLHAATIKPWAKRFDREPPETKALRRHITSLILKGMRL